jgi:2'-5' RNA ligase
MRRHWQAMRPPLPRFAVAWFPDLPGLERIESFRRRHDPMAAKAPAHVTLVFAFSTPLSALQLETHVRKVCAGWPSIPVTFSAIRPHANEFVFLMAQRGAASISGLHDKLYARSLLPHLRRDLAYEPHITVARCEAPEALDAALADADMELRGEFAATLREVSLLAVAADGRIDRLKDLPLDAR